MTYIAPAPAHALGPKLGEMSRERAFELNGWITDLWFWLEDIAGTEERAKRAADALESVPLTDMLTASHMVAADPGDQNERSNRVMTCFCADRAVAAIYCFINRGPHYGRSRVAIPRPALLPIKGSLTERED